jgi:hypothetical protein
MEVKKVLGKVNSEEVTLGFSYVQYLYDEALNAFKSYLPWLISHKIWCYQ